MESLSKSHFLSREEEVELARSDKKLKDVHHIGFSTGQGESQLHQYRNTFSSGNGCSFKGKLMGEIPRAYNQAFELDSHMETEDDSNDEVTELREGMATVTLSKDVKQRIRAPWINSSIVKVYGKVVGYHFLQAKLLVLWKPSGKLDFINLGKEFYLIRFGLKKDYSTVLEKGL